MPKRPRPKGRGRLRSSAIAGRLTHAVRVTRQVRDDAKRPPCSSARQKARTNRSVPSRQRSLIEYRKDSRNPQRMPAPQCTNELPTFTVEHSIPCFAEVALSSLRVFADRG